MGNADFVCFCVLEGIAILLAILLIITHFRDKKQENKRYYDAVGNWLSGRRR